MCWGIRELGENEEEQESIRVIIRRIFKKKKLYV